MDESPPRPFAHLNAPLHELYRRVMGVFRVSKQRFVVHLRPEDVTEALHGNGAALAVQDDVQEALARLAEWGNLRATPDTSRVTTVEDFYRTRYLYQLSREGEAAERALEVYEQEIARRGELQAVALEDIRLRLRALAGLPADPDPAGGAQPPVGTVRSAGQPGGERDRVHERPATHDRSPGHRRGRLYEL